MLVFQILDVSEKILTFYFLTHFLNFSWIRFQDVFLFLFTKITRSSTTKMTMFESSKMAALFVFGLLVVSKPKVFFFKYFLSEKFLIEKLSRRVLINIDVSICQKLCSQKDFWVLFKQSIVIISSESCFKIQKIDFSIVSKSCSSINSRVQFVKL